MLLEELIRADAQVGEDAVDPFQLELGEDVAQLGEVGVEEADFAGGAGEAGLGVLEVAGVDVEADEAAGGAEALGDFGGVTGAAEGAIDEGRALGGGQGVEDLVHEDGVVTAGGEVHGAHHR
jgi:hypothetical protein